MFIRSKDFNHWFEENKSAIVRELIDALKINTQSPNEQKLFPYIKGKLERMGFCLAEQEITTPNNLKCQNLCGRLLVSPHKNFITINCHLDTIPFSKINNKNRCFCENDIIYGRGSCDNKGNLIGMLFCLEFLAKYKIPLKYNLKLDFVSAEEIGGYGTKNLLKNESYVGGIVIVLEPTQNKICNAARGCLPFVFYKKAEACHIGADTQKRIYKISRLLRLLRSLDKKLISELKLSKFHNFWKNTTGVHVTKIKAGEWHGATPEEIYLRGNVTFSPKHTISYLKEHLISVSKKTGFQLILQEPTLPYFNLGIGQDTKTMQKYFNTNSLFKASCDAVFYKELGYNAFVFGAGELKDAHATYEKIKLKDIKKFIFLLTKFLTQD